MTTPKGGTGMNAPPGPEHNHQRAQQNNTESMTEAIETLRARKQRAAQHAGPAAVQRHRAKGKLTARERIGLLFDSGTFTEFGMLTQRRPNPLLDGKPEAADGLVCGRGRVNGALAYVAADDATVIGGSRGLNAERKQARLMSLAVRDRCPFIWLQEASAGRFQEMTGPEFSIFGGREFALHIQMSGQIPIIAAVLGAGFGGPTFRAVIADFVPVVRNQGYMGISGPPMVKMGTGEVMTVDEIGGTDITARDLGLADLVVDDDAACIAAIKLYLSYMPGSCWSVPGRTRAPEKADSHARPALNSLVPTNPRHVYDMRPVIEQVVDGGKFFEIKPDYGRSAITCLARIGGYSVGIIANQPLVIGGVINTAAAVKMTAFLQRCNSFNLPIVFLQDQPGVLIGRQADRSGLAREVTRLVLTVGRVRVPRLSVVIRKAYGLGYLAMSGRAMDPDLFVVWPIANMTAVGPGPAVETLFGREISLAQDPVAARADYLADFQARSDPYVAAASGYVDDMIEPSQTRAVLIEALEASAERVAAGCGPKDPIVP